MSLDHSLDRLRKTERQGLRLAILCRTAVATAAFVWLIGSSWSVGATPNIWGTISLFGYVVFGLLYLRFIGTERDRPWIKHVIYTVDILGVCALFALIPISRAEDVPQIIAFRAYGIYYLFPFIALATLSLSWTLVLWSGIVAVIGWWATFWSVVVVMPSTLSWGDMPIGATVQDYEAIFLSIDFIGMGNRIEESGTLFAAAAILALTVHRARKVFFAQVTAEQQQRLLMGTFGEYVPRQLAAQVLEDPGILTPQSRRATVMSVDIAGFTTLVERSTPTGTFAMLDEFFGAAAGIVDRHNGAIVDYSGDGFLAAFNVPLPIDHHEQHAVNTAKALFDMVADRAFAAEHLTIRIGIATGDVAAGSVGGGGRKAYTVHGDTVNLAARLQDMAKKRGVNILIDGATASALPTADIQQIDAAVPVRGRQQAIEIYGFANDPVSTSSSI